jgi:hypothetical protein
MAITKVINDLIDLNATDATKSLKMPSGAAYSGTAQDGMVRNDTDGDSQGSASTMQHFNGTDWKNYENLPNSITTDFLVVAGGGGGGAGYSGASGGGAGAGGLKTTTTYSGSETPLAASLGTAYNVTVGPGGISTANGSLSGASGGNSEFNGIISTGGGGGGNNNAYGPSTAPSGGSGGGGYGPATSGTSSGGSEVSGQGNAGGNSGAGASGGAGAGGGGGADAAGSVGSGAAGTSSGGVGGDGLESLITGVATYYAGGGGGGGQAINASGGLGGGGNGGFATPVSGSLNTGGGGGGGSVANSTSGGSGTVILRYPTASVSSHAVTGTLDTTADTAYPIANTAYYKLNDDVLDSSGNGYNGTATSVTYAAGRFGQAAVFNGSSSRITTNLITPNTQDLSWSFWVKDLVHNGSSSMNTLLLDYKNNYAFINYTSSNTLYANARNSSTNADIDVQSSAIDTSSWRHIVFVSSLSSGSFLYIDGALVDSNTASMPSRLSINYGSGLEIGWNPAEGSPFTAYALDGSIDQVRIFNSALSAGNVTSLYNEGTVVEGTDGTDSILQFIGGTGTVTFS